MGRLGAFGGPKQASGRGVSKGLRRVNEAKFLTEELFVKVGSSEKNNEGI